MRKRRDLAGDTDDDGNGSLEVEAGFFATNDGGSVLLEADGDFTYFPAAATSCSDTSDFFDYTVTDQNRTKEPTIPATDTGRVTIAITGCVWYVSNFDPSGNSGTSDEPFDTLAQAQAASSAGDTIYPFDGSNTTGGYDDGFVLKDNQRLLGEAATLQIGSDVLYTGIPANRPTITNFADNVVTLASGNTVRGVQIDPNQSGGIFGGVGDTGGTIDDVRVIDTGGAGTFASVELSGTAGAWTISDLTVDNAAATGQNANSHGVRVLDAGSVTFAGTNSIRTKGGGTGFAAEGATNLGTSVVDSVTVIGGVSGGVTVIGTTGSLQLKDLSLATSGAFPALKISDAGPVTMPNAGTANIDATGNSAVQVFNSAPQLDLDTVNASNLGGAGIILTNTGAGTFSATGGTISGYSETGIRIEGGSGNISYGGAIGDGAGQLATITLRTGGTVTLSGTLTDGPDSGGGIAMFSNSGGSTVLSGASKTIDSGALIGMTMSGNTGHTVSISGGGLNVTTATGYGLLMSGGGALNVTGSGNTITTGAAPAALAIDDSTIGASNATFERISSNGATNGIRLNNTGSLGRLIVTGNGGTCASGSTAGCSGGEIANSSASNSTSVVPPGTAIALNNTLNPSFTRMWIHDHTNYGVSGTGVAGFTLSSSVIDGTNGNSATNNEGAMRFNGLTGTATISSSFIGGGATDNISVVNDSGALSASVTGSTIAGTSLTTGGDGIHMRGTGTGSMALDVQSSTFRDNRGDHIQMTTDATNTVTQNLTVNGSTFTTTAAADPSVLGGGITFDPGGNAVTDVTLTNNNIQQAFSSAIAIDTLGSAADPQPATIDATITGNIIGTAATADSGSESGDGISVSSNGLGDVDALITNNTIRQYANSAGIDILQNDGDGSLDATVRANTIASPGSSALNGISVRAGTAGGTETGLTCVDIGHASNATLENSLTGSGKAPDYDIRVRQLARTTARLPGYTGEPNDDSIVGPFLALRNNPVSTPTVLTSNTWEAGGGGFVNAASCTLP